jgi:MFS family permease
MEGVQVKQVARWRPSGLWRNRDFIKLWAGRVISEVGSHITGQAVPLTAVMVLGAAPAQLGVISALGGAPVLLLGLLAGVWVDRRRRRPLLIAADLARAGVLFSVPLAAALGVLQVAQLYVVIAITGALTVLFEVADQSYLPSLVEREHLLEGNSKMGAGIALAEIVGPGLGGVLVQILTAPIAIAFDAASFLVSAASVALIRKPEPPAPPATGRASVKTVWADVVAGLALVWRHPVLRPLVGTAATHAFFGNFIGALYTIYLIRDIGASPALLGILIGLGGISSLLGSAFAGTAARRFGVGRTLVGTHLVGGLLAFMIPLAPSTPIPGQALPLAIALLALSQLTDWTGAIYGITEISVRQAVTPERWLGRMNASMSTAIGGASPLGALAGGVLGGMIGVRPTLYVAVSGIVLSVAWLLWSPVRGLRSVEPVAFSETHD